MPLADWGGWRCNVRSSCRELKDARRAFKVLEGELDRLLDHLDCSPAVTPWGSYPVVRRWRPE
eukprot:8022121-Alexandrium_andersonii.AAC.1